MEKLTKDEISKRMVEFYREHLFVLFLITMGGGKTKGSLDCVVTKFGYKRKGLIVCHNARSRDVTWPEEIKYWHPQFKQAMMLGFVRIIHKNDLLKLKADWYDWIIFDECHKLEKEHLIWIKVNVIQSIILMTGTETDDPFMSRNIRNLVKQAVLEFPTEDAIDQGLINDYKVKAIEVHFSELDQANYEKICLSLTKSKFIGKPEVVKAIQGKRMRFIYESRAKIEVVARLNKLLSDKRRLLILTTKEACAEISPYIFHSSTKETDFTKFANGEIDELASIRQLKTGANIKNFDHIVCSQFNSKYEDFMQLLGRLFRLEPGRIGYIYAIFLKNTQDQAWFSKAVRKVPSHKIKYYDVREMSLEQIVNDSF